MHRWDSYDRFYQSLAHTYSREIMGESRTCLILWNVLRIRRFEQRYSLMKFVAQTDSGIEKYPKIETYPMGCLILTWQNRVPLELWMPRIRPDHTQIGEKAKV